MIISGCEDGNVTDFPNWKKNEILRKRKNAKNLYIRTVNKFTYGLYCKIFGLLK